MTEELSPVLIPHTRLDPETLRNLIESFVTREGTDYGEREIAHDTKIEQVRRQLENGTAVIRFDPESESIDIVKI